MRITRRSSIFFLSLVLAAGVPSTAGASGLPPRADRVTHADEVDPKQEPTTAVQVAPDRVVVKWKVPGKAAAVADSHGLRVLGALEIPDVALVATAGRPVNDVVAELRSSPDVAWAEPDYLLQLADQVAEVAPVTLPDAASVAVNDPLTADQYSLDRMHVREAWSVTAGGSDVVAVLDTGVWASHPDLAGRLAAGRNFVADPANDNTADDNGHGTWVSGIIAANPNNGVGIAGVTWTNKVMPVKVMNANGSGFTSDLAEGIRWATDQGASVINMSIGGYANSSLLHDAIAYAWSHNVVMVAAAGNARSAIPTYPAAFSEVISVSATQIDDEFSNWSNYGTSIDVSAPGASVLTINCDRTVVAACPYYNNYIYISGTSFATPNVAAVAALVRSRYPAMTGAQVVAQIKSTADDLGYPGTDDRYGRGRVNAMRAVGGTAAAADPGSGDGLEPNNSLGATKVVAVGGTFRPSIHPAGDVDFFAFDVPRPGRLDLSVTPILDSRPFPWTKSSLLVDPVLNVYNASGTLLMTVDDPGSSAATERASIQMSAAGRIVLRVNNWTPNGNRQAYSVASAFVDNVAPLITGRQPGPNQGSVAFDSSMRVTFNEAVSGVGGGSVLLTTGGGTPVASSVTYDAAKATAVLPPSVPLAGEATYRISVTSAVKDVAGNALSPQAWSFTTGPAVTRLAGADRFATAAAISRSGFGAGVAVAYIATGTNFPDALAAGPVAARSGGPILLSARDTLPAATAAELARLRPGRIVVLGGTGAISEGVRATLVGYATSGSVTRLAGADRYATAAAISASGWSANEPATAYLATGASFADALAAAALAGVTGSPLLITAPTSLVDATRAELGRLSPSNVVLLGGPGALSDAVLSGVKTTVYGP